MTGPARHDFARRTTDEDRAQVAALLGRPPRGAFEVAVRSGDGSPLVIENAPFLDDGTPMPTRFWLVGEPLRARVGTLESTGAVDRVEAELGPEVIAELHQRYADEREARIPAGHEGPRPFGGVGGTRRGVKCLHAHLAWHLAGGDDAVGRWVADRLAEEGHRIEVAPVVAAVDCGTNSTRLLVARRGPGGGLEPLVREMRVTRLGQGVDRTGRLDDDAIARTSEVLATYRRILEAHRVTAVRATATSAARDASNADAFFTAAHDALGVTPELLSGEEEGRLSFAGATASLDPGAGPFLVADIGGGSTELVVGTRGADGTVNLDGVRSLDIGCVRLTERYLRDDPPNAVDLAAATAEADAMIRGALAEIPSASEVATLVGCAGTVSTMAAIDLGLAGYDRTRTHHHVLRAEVVAEATASLAAMAVAERRAVPGMEAARADVLVGGLVVLGALVDALGAASVLVSETDILDGLASSLLDGGDAPRSRTS